MKPGFDRDLLVILTVLLLSLAISACVQVQVESEFEEDGSGRHSMTLAVERSLLDDAMLGNLESELDFDAIERQAEAGGLEVERIDTADRFGIMVSTEVEDNEDLGQVLADLVSTLVGMPLPLDSFRGGFSQSNGGIGGTSYQFELTVDGSQLIPVDPSELDQNLDDEQGMGFDFAMIQQLVNLTYTVSMPGEVTDHNGTTQGPGRVQWNVPLEGSETFIAESEEGSSFSLALILGIIIGIAALALIIIGAMTLLRGQRTPTGVPPAGTEQVGQSDQPIHPVTGQPDHVTEVEIRDEPGSWDDHDDTR